MLEQMDDKIHLKTSCFNEYLEPAAEEFIKHLISPPRHSFFPGRLTLSEMQSLILQWNMHATNN